MSAATPVVVPDGARDETETDRDVPWHRRIRLVRRPPLAAQGTRALALAATVVLGVGVALSVTGGGGAPAPAAQPGRPAAAAALGPVTPTGPDEFRTPVQAVHSGLCVTADGGAVVQEPCASGAAQNVAFRMENGRYQVRVGDGCLAASGPTTQDGVTLRTTTCPGLAVDLEVVPGLTDAYRLLAAPGRCLEVLGGESEPGAGMGIWSCGDVSSAGNQVFRFGTGAAAVSRPVAVAATPDGVPSTAPASRPSSGVLPPGDWSPQAVVRRGLAGTAPAWGRQPPPAGAVASRAYALAVTVTPKGYSPRAGECPVAVHARYWMFGPDGKVYPTWHPARDPSGCAFGHEHGDDPRTSNLFRAVGWPAFGYTNEQLAPSNPLSRRDEDHVGHKVAVLNQVRTHPGNDVNRPASQVCDTYLKLHQGTHSPDALASNLHELFYNARCRHTADGSVTEAHVQVLLPIGVPGSFNSTNTCDGSGNTVHAHVAEPHPADSVEGGGVRKIPDADCAASILAGNGDITRFTELWTLELHTRGQGGLQRLDLNPYAHVNNPARYYDPASPTKIGHTIDLCYRGARGADCDAVRAITARTGKQVAWDDPRSPFDGARRRLNPNYLVVVNTGPSVMYSDVFGRNWTTSWFPGAIRQYVRGTYDDAGDQGDIFVGGDVGPHEVDYAANPRDGVRAPN